MLRSRIIPCLLIQDKGLVKTEQFKNPKYVGDPLNAVKIFNEKQADEIIVLDIDATVKNQEPDYKLIERIANECRMPLCYGGGIKNKEQAQRIFNLGVEKIAISSVAIENPNIITEIAEEVGNQSVVVVLDVKKKKTLFGKEEYLIYTHNGNKKSNLELVDFIEKIKHLGIGELVINDINNDGVMKGYDMNLIDTIKQKINMPLTCLGGAGSLSDIKNLVDKYNTIGVVAGSLFVFKGIFKAVLISYPNIEEKRKINNLQ